MLHLLLHNESKGGRKNNQRLRNQELDVDFGNLGYSKQTTSPTKKKPHVFTRKECSRVLGDIVLVTPFFAVVRE